MQIRRHLILSSLAVLLSGTQSFAQDSAVTSQRQVCQGLPLEFALVSIKRLSQGTLRMEAEFENKSNVAYRIGWDKHALGLVDDQGDSWKLSGNATKLLIVPPGAKARDWLEFSLHAGGGGAKAASVQLRRGVYPVGKIGQYGTCTFAVKDAPIGP